MFFSFMQSCFHRLTLSLLKPTIPTIKFHKNIKQLFPTQHQMEITKVIIVMEKSLRLVNSNWERKLVFGPIIQTELLQQK